MTHTAIRNPDPFAHDPAYPEPTEPDTRSREFNAIWEAIKKWDISRYGSAEGMTMYHSATGNDAMHILIALRNEGLLK